MEKLGFCDLVHNKKKYEIFDAIDRSEIFHFSRSVAEYLKNEKISNLIILDRSARPLYVGVKEYFHSKYPDERIPDIYFLNPKGFKARENIDKYDVESIADDCIWKNDLVEGIEDVKKHKEITKDFKESYKKLIDFKDEPILLFDGCIHSGASLKPILNTLEELEFSNIKIGTINPPDEESGINADFYITERKPERGCYPFGRDKIVEKTFSHVYSQKTADQEKIENSVLLRKEIKQIMKDFLEKE